ncbi:MAG: fold metallo-hydrolase [Solirubrobacterales bacterium]|jgi:glyoxylase-like metal-dependent hydrolase (beta-lactamase superfamily II)|nr:fold metallo-hydrolase [Solirubrobacterales bacterium]
MFQPDVVPGVHRGCDADTNWYLLQEDDRLTLVDAGLPASYRTLRSGLGELGLPMTAIQALVLTHGHFDHVGMAERLRLELNIPVLVHPADVELTKHPMTYRTERRRERYLLTQVQALPVMARLARAGAFRPAPVQQVTTFADGQVLDVPGRPRVVFTPGHTDGHCALFLEQANAVISADALVTLDPYTNRRGPRLVARAATADVQRNLASLDALQETRAQVVLPGHGEPFRSGVGAAVRMARQAGAA